MLRNLRNRSTIQLVKQSNLYQQLLYNSTTSQPAVTDTEGDFKNQLKQYEKLTNIVHRTRTKKPQRPPFAKNLFLGDFDTEVLTYPQLEKEDIDNLELTIEQVDRLVKQELNVHTKFDKRFLQNLSDYKLIGLQCSSFESGRECNVSEHTKILEELCHHNLRNSLVHNEQLGVQTLIKYGSNELRKKYLEQVMSGKNCIAFCMAEENLNSLANLCTKAVLSPDGKNWILNGDKIWVVNGDEADLFIVFALTDVVVRDKLRFPKVTAFLVDKKFGGLTTKKYNVNEMNLSRITFENTPVPTENIIGGEGNGEQMLMSVISEFRLSYGPLCTAISKKLVNNLQEYVVKETNEENMLLKTDAIREKMGEIVLSTYAMESMTYLTTGLLDSYENQDCELETAIIKLFCSQKAHEIATTCLNIIGTPALEESHWCNTLYRDSLKYLTLHETNNNLKIIIALLGLRHAGNTLNEKIQAIRNPLFNASTVLKRMWNTRKDIDDNPEFVLKLNENLHPSLLMAANNLEYCVLRLKFGTEILLTRYGADIVNMHMELNRIADCIIDIYALTAVLGRASRSYCIGLQHGDYEMLMANAFSNNILERVKYNINKIYEGQCQTNDENYRVISKKLIKFKGYFPKHPLARNF